MPAVTLPISRWATWVPEEGAPRLESVPPMQRRRLSTLARTAVSVVAQVVPTGESLPTVYASRHGEIVSTLEMLRGISAAEVPSPTAFSHAVHNGVLGQMSMLRKDRSPGVAVAAGREGLAAALLEAAGMMAEGAPRVLVVACDEALPAFYAATLPDDGAYAVAMLLEAGAPAYQLELAERGNGVSGTEAARALARLAKADTREVRLGGERRDWILRRAA